MTCVCVRVVVIVRIIIPSLCRRKFFSKNGQSTLVEKEKDKDKDHSVQAMGQRSHLTKLDVQKLKQLYRCGTGPPPPPPPPEIPPFAADAMFSK